MDEPGVPIPPPYDDPANWPFKWLSYDQARGIVERVRAENSSETKAVAAEYGVHVSSVKRAMVWFLYSIGQYDPDPWRRHSRRRKAEGRRWFLEKMREVERQKAEAKAVTQQARATLAAERLALEASDPPLHVATSQADEEDKKRRRRELQRRLNARNRPRA